MKERNIGEIFEVNGEWYQCISDTTDDNCNNCFFQKSCSNITGDCSSIARSDGKSVCFKKLEKVGEQFLYKGKQMQSYIRATDDLICNWNNNILLLEHGDSDIIDIEIKQNKQDMKENYKAEDTLLTRLVGRYVNNLIDYETFEKAVKELYSDKKDSKPTLKEFDLEAAKAGKLVCTRDGRNARIICFDRRLFYKNVSYPILALVECSDGEDDVCGYNEKGKVLIEDGAEYKDDLMMLPEKKAGWVNVYKGGLLDTKSYPTKKEAFDRACPEGYVDTVKVCWEE